MDANSQMPSPPKAEIDFGELLRKPSRLFATAYVYFLLAGGALGYLYLWQLTDIGKNAVPPAPALQDSAALLQDIPFQSAAVLPPVDVNVASIPTPELLARGRDLYKANCSSCHGDNGRGDGPSAPTMNPKPRNFRDTSGWTNGARIHEIYRTLEEGIVRNGMAAYNYLPPLDRFALIHVVRSFQTSPPATPESDILQLETVYQLSKGSSLPAQIPISVATQKVLQESAPIRERVEQRVRAIQASDDPGARLLRSLAGDLPKAVASLGMGEGGFPSAAEFARRVGADPLAVGLRASVTRLSPAEWNSLYEYLAEAPR
jgi:mono/diheme cytochrome c family protein